MSEKCPNCGAKNDSNVKFCANCGTKLVNDKEEGVKICPNCQEKNIKDSEFCINCGTSLNGAKLTKICPKCLKKNSDDSEFCANCGLNFKKDNYSKGITKVCPNCNKIIDDTVKVCGNCGYDFYAAKHIANYTGPINNPNHSINNKNSNLSNDIKDINTITVYSIIVIGLGHYYNGLENKAVLTGLIGYTLLILWLVSNPIFFLILLIFYILQIVDARKNFVEIENGIKPTILGYDDFLDK